MKIENQVCSLELAEKLKKLRVEQESYFYWDNRTGINKYVIVNKDFFKVDKRNSISAFTATELLEMLPEEIDNKYILEIGKSGGEYQIYYVDRSDEISDYCFNKGEDDIDVDDKNFANALAKMLIYIRENKLN